MNEVRDPILDSIVRELRTKYKCHTIILYGSRARGLTTATSDYDVIGIRQRGEKIRIAKKERGFYWDVFVYSEKDLRKLGSSHLNLRNARLLYASGTYGKRLLRRIDKLLQKPHKPQPQYEIDAAKVWAKKELDRCKVNDIQGLYRRAEILTALVQDYFIVRKKQFWGAKASFDWMQKNDPQTLELMRRALENQNNLSYLKSAVGRVYKIQVR